MLYLCVSKKKGIYPPKQFLFYLDIFFIEHDCSCFRSSCMIYEMHMAIYNRCKRCKQWNTGVVRKKRQDLEGMSNKHNNNNQKGYYNDETVPHFS
jgi:hypothetical protein